MGCTQSRIDNEESVARCKERRNLMKEAAAARNAFAAGHSGYAMALKNTGAALSDYGHGETVQTQELHPQPPMDPTSEPPPPPPPLMDELIPPPPLPNFSPSPIKRAISMPAMSVKMQKDVKEGNDVIVEEDEEEEEERDGNVGKNEKDLDVMRTPQKESSGVAKGEVSNPVTPPMPEPKGMAWDYFFNVDNMPGPALDGDEVDEEEDVGSNEEENNGGMGSGEIGGNGGGDDEPKTPKNVVENVAEEENVVENGKQIEHAKTAPAEFRRVGKDGSSGGSLMKVLNDLDDHFLKASESAQDVSKMLEATRLHYHSNFADNRGKIITFALNARLGGFRACLD